MNLPTNGQQNLPAKSGEQRFIDDILQKALQAKIVTPESYAMENAIKSAWLEIVQKNYHNQCSQESILNSVMDMIVQGLNPAKDQCYFIKFGNVLKCMRSYMGSVAVTKRFDLRVAEVNAEIIYGGDELDFEIKNGVKLIGQHKQQFGNIKNDNIHGAYAVAVDADGNQLAADIMTWEEILNSWERSQKKGEGQPVLKGALNPKSDHAKQPARFARRTVINRLCKQLISVTDDSQLLRAVRKTDEDTPDAEIVEIELQQQQEQPPQVIDFTPRQDPDPVMATRDHAAKIVELSKKANAKDKIFENLTAFTGRKIEKIGELTAEEAEEYIRIIESELGPDDEDQPDWA